MVLSCSIMPKLIFIHLGERSQVVPKKKKISQDSVIEQVYRYGRKIAGTSSWSYSSCLNDFAALAIVNGMH